MPNSPTASPTLLASPHACGPQIASDHTGASVTAEVPSNIALIKYWGKRAAAEQWPANDSLSMTLSSARTRTTATLHNGPSDIIQFLGDGPAPETGGSQGKAGRHLAFLRRELGLQAPLLVQTQNSFPAGCGIASSASGFGALTLAAVAAWTGAADFAGLERAGFSRERLAHLARMGSGSACRSLFGGYVEWTAGASSAEQRVAPLPGEPWQLVDLIVIVSAEAKAVSSSAGHITAWTSPLFAPRLAGVAERLRTVRAALAARDLEQLGTAIEAEALEMHAVMLSAQPTGLNYLLPATSACLTWLRHEREAHGLPAYFTLDAGPNVHVLCEPAAAAEVAAQLQAAFPDCTILQDRTGEGPTLHRTGRA